MKIILKNVFLFLLLKNKRLEDVYMGMLAKRLKTSINNYSIHYMGLNVRELPTMEKTRLLTPAKTEETFFLYEKGNFSYFWNIFTKIMHLKCMHVFLLHFI